MCGPGTPQGWTPPPSVLLAPGEEMCTVRFGTSRQICGWSCVESLTWAERVEVAGPGGRGWGPGVSLLPAPHRASHSRISVLQSLPHRPAMRSFLQGQLSSRPPRECRLWFQVLVLFFTVLCFPGTLARSSFAGTLHCPEVQTLRLPRPQTPLLCGQLPAVELWSPPRWWRPAVPGRVRCHVPACACRVPAEPPWEARLSLWLRSGAQRAVLQGSSSARSRPDERTAPAQAEGTRLPPSTSR